MLLSLVSRKLSSNSRKNSVDKEFPNRQVKICCHNMSPDGFQVEDFRFRVVRNIPGKRRLGRQPALPKSISEELLKLIKVIYGNTIV
jgi:hypothetical protein